MKLTRVSLSVLSVLSFLAFATPAQANKIDVVVPFTQTLSNNDVIYAAYDMRFADALKDVECSSDPARRVWVAYANKDEVKTVALPVVLNDRGDVSGNHVVADSSGLIKIVTEVEQDVVVQCRYVDVQS